MNSKEHLYQALHGSLALLNPNWNLDPSPHPVDTVHPPASTPLEWAYLSSIFQDQTLTLFDEYARASNFSETTRMLIEVAPDAILISTSPSFLYWRCPPLNVELARRYVESIRDAGVACPVIVIGPHGTSHPEYVLRYTNADGVMRGEPDQALPMSNEQEISSKALGYLAVPGDLGQIAPQGSLSVPADYAIFNQLADSYEAHAWGTAARRTVESLSRGRSATLEYSRGCSFDCSFCLRNGFRRFLRRKSRMIAESELSSLEALGIDYVFLIDENSAVPWEDYAWLARELFNRSIRFGMQTRPDCLTHEKLGFLEKTGLVYLELGLEAWEDSIQNHLSKFGNVDYAIEMAAAAKDKIPAVNINIFSPPMNTPDEMIQRDNEGAKPGPHIALPGTPDGDRRIAALREEGIRGTDWLLCECLFLVDSARNGVEHQLHHILEDKSDATHKIKALVELWDTGGFFTSEGAITKTRFESVVENSHPPIRL